MMGDSTLGMNFTVFSPFTRLTLSLVVLSTALT